MEVCHLKIKFSAVLSTLENDLNLGSKLLGSCNSSSVGESYHRVQQLNIYHIFHSTLSVAAFSSGKIELLRSALLCSYSSMCEYSAVEC